METRLWQAERARRRDRDLPNDAALVRLAGVLLEQNDGWFCPSLPVEGLRGLVLDPGPAVEEAIPLTPT